MIARRGQCAVRHCPAYDATFHITHSELPVLFESEKTSGVTAVGRAGWRPHVAHTGIENQQVSRPDLGADLLRPLPLVSIGQMVQIRVEVHVLG